MKINAQSLQARVKNRAIELGVNANILFTTYYFDCFLNRIIKSAYSDNFVFKGGFLLTSILGIQNRFTVDIDFSFRRKEFSRAQIEFIINEIINIRSEDNVNFEIDKISTIRDEDEYGGFRIKINVKFENMKSSITVDIATGDPITPAEINYKYRCLLTNEEFFFKSYNIETILAEKIQTLLNRGSFNSRCKDYYDIYILCKLKMNEINLVHLKDAFGNTCKYRKTAFTNEEIFSIINQIKADADLEKRWGIYSKKMKYATDIMFIDVIDVIEELIYDLIGTKVIV